MSDDKALLAEKEISSLWGATYELKKTSFILAESEEDEQESSQFLSRSPSIYDESEEIWEVKALHYDKVPEQSSLGIIKNLNESQKKRCDEALEDMNNELEEIKCDTENSFHNKSNYIIGELENIKLSLEDKMQKLIAKNISEVQEEDFKNMECYIESSVQKHAHVVENYYEDIRNSDKQKNEKIEAVFKKCHTILCSIYFKLPDDLQDYFDAEIEKIKRITLCSSQSYKELYANLLAQGNVQGNAAKEKLADFKMDCEAWKLEQIYDKLGREKLVLLPEEDAEKIDESQYFAANLRSVEEMVKKLLELHGEHLLLEDEPVVVLPEKVRHVALHIDSHVTEMLDMYKIAVRNIYAGLHETHTELKLKSELSITKINNLKNSVQTSILNKTEREISTLKNPWSQALQTMQKNLEHFYEFLESSMKVWDAHFSGVKEAQNTVLQALEKQIEKNDLLIDEKEIKLSKELSSLRQESTEEKLAVKLQTVGDILREIKTVHEQNFQREADSIAELNKLMDPLSRTLVIAIKELLNTYPQQKTETAISIGSAPQADTKVALLPRILRLCNLQISALENWKQGFWIGMEQYRKKCYEEIKQMACDWIRSETKKARERLETKLFEHETRHDHIVSEIYNIRLAELRLHKQRYLEHKEGVIKTLNNLKSQLNQLVNKLNEDLISMKNILIEKEKMGRETRKSALAIAKMNQLENLLRTYPNEVTEAMKTFEHEFQRKISWLQDSNTKYIQSIKCFSEDGNFGAEEAKTYTVELKGINKMIEKSVSEIKKQALMKECGLIQEGEAEIEWKIEILRKVTEELMFSEKALNVLTITESQIKREVFTLKYKIQLLKDIAEEILSIIHYHSESQESMLNFYEKWEQLFKSLIIVRDYLLQPSFDTKDASSNTVSTIPLKFNCQLDTKTSKDAVSSLTFGNKVFRDYSQFLFGIKEELPSNDSFMSNICIKMLKYFSELQKLSCEFYSTRTSQSIIKLDIIQSQYYLFIKEMLIKLKYYHLQCEEAWIAHVQDFLNLITKLRQAINSYSGPCIEDAHNKNRKALKEIKETFTSSLENETERNFQNLREKLKLLLEYPKNNEMLEDLDQSALESYSALKENIPGITSKYMTKFRNKCISSASDLLSLQNSVQCIFKRMFDPSLTEVLKLQVAEVEESISLSLIKKMAAAEEGKESIKKGKTKKDKQEKIPDKKSNKKDEYKKKVKNEKPKTTKKSEEGKVKEKKTKKGKVKEDKGKKNLQKKEAKGKEDKNEDISEDIKVYIDRRNIPEEHKLVLAEKLLLMELKKTCILTVNFVGLPNEPCHNLRFHDLDMSNNYKEMSIQPCLEAIEKEKINFMMQEYKDEVESFEKNADMQAIRYEKTTDEWLRIWKLNIEQAKEQNETSEMS